jgi:hypothetical protein
MGGAGELEQRALERVHGACQRSGALAEDLLLDPSSTGTTSCSPTSPS